MDTNKKTPKKTIRLFIKKREKATDPHLNGKILDESENLIYNLVLWETKSKAGETYYRGYVNEPNNEK